MSRNCYRNRKGAKLFFAPGNNQWSYLFVALVDMVVRRNSPVLNTGCAPVFAVEYLPVAVVIGGSEGGGEDSLTRTG